MASHYPLDTSHWSLCPLTPVLSPRRGRIAVSPFDCRSGLKVVAARQYLFSTWELFSDWEFSSFSASFSFSFSIRICSVTRCENPDRERERVRKRERAEFPSAKHVRATNGVPSPRKEGRVRGIRACEFKEILQNAIRSTSEFGF